MYDHETLERAKNEMLLKRNEIKKIKHKILILRNLNITDKLKKSPAFSKTQMSSKDAKVMKASNFQGHLQGQVWPHHSEKYQKKVFCLNSR